MQAHIAILSYTTIVIALQADEPHAQQWLAHLEEEPGECAETLRAPYCTEAYASFVEGVLS